MSSSRLKSLLPHGQVKSFGMAPNFFKSSTVTLSQYSIPAFSTWAAIVSANCLVTCGLPQRMQSNAGIGTPQTRCREIHHSARFFDKISQSRIAPRRNEINIFKGAASSLDKVVFGQVAEPLISRPKTSVRSCIASNEGMSA